MPAYTSKSIKVIKTDRERIKKRPTMYIPSTGKEGAMHIIFEIIDNSFDELSVKGTVGNDLQITFDEKTKECTVQDNGRGIPLDSLYDVYTVIAASGKFDNDETTAYATSGGSFGAGAKTMVYLTKWCEVASYREGKSLLYKFDDGLLKDTIRGTTKKHGSYAKFLIDQKYVDIQSVSWKDIYERLVEKSYIFPDIRVTLTVTKSGKDPKVYELKGNTIAHRVEEWKPDTDLITFQGERKVTFLKNIDDDKVTTEKVYIDFAFAYKEAVLDAESKDDYIISYANSIKTYAGGTHVDGLKLGIQKYFKEVVIPKLKGSDKDLNIMPSDTIAGLCGFIQVKLYDPRYRAQHKDKLDNVEVRYAVRDAVFDALSEAKPSVIHAMLEFVKRVTKGRAASKKVRKKDVSNVFSKDRLEKFKDVVHTLKTTDPEIIIVEGDSAANNAVTARDPYNQAIYPIKRPANVFDIDSEHVSKIKSTFNDILDICGIEPGKKCDPSKSTMNRILLMTDGDVDGDDIAISTVCLLAKHCRPLIDAGMVGRILPPAYSIPVGNGKKIYVRSQREFFDKIIKQFIKNEKVSHFGREMSVKELRQFIQLNFEYDIRLDNLASRQCCDPKFMEYICWHYHGHAKDQKKSYWMKMMKPYPEISVLLERGSVVLDGNLPGSDYVNLGFDDYVDRHINRFKAFQAKNEDIFHYAINGEKDKSIYDVMHTIRKYIPKGVERFKGLGELGPEEMQDLCMDKNKRTVIIFKFKDFEKDMDKISVIMSSKRQYVEARSQILMSMRISDIDLDT